ncbi:MAG: Sec-independent protein translocase protein TatB [Usitatibacter sp.]
MFDIGFSEIFVIGVVALVVIGPERLPKVARTLGILFGRLQRYVTQVKSDISREMELAELGKVKSEFENAARSFRSDIESQAAQAEREVRELRTAVDRELVGEPPAAEPAATETPAAEAAARPPPSPQLELGIEPPAPSGAARPTGAG